MQSNTDSSFFNSMMEKAMAQIKVPKCAVCKQIIASGALPYQDESGEVLNVCLICVIKALRYYIKNRNERMNEQPAEWKDLSDKSAKPKPAIPL